MGARSTTGLPGLRIRVANSPTALDEWSIDIDHAPTLAANGFSHLWLGAGISKWLFPDIVIRPLAVEIRAPPSEVWDIFIDFDKYSEWNGYVIASAITITTYLSHFAFYWYVSFSASIAAWKLWRNRVASLGSA